VLRFQAPRAGQYTVKTICARNGDFGRVTFKVGNIARQLNFHADKLSWGQYQLGDCQLEAGPQDITITAHGSSGQNGIVCHLGLDALSLREK
jgi:hypothetical protein